MDMEHFKQNFNYHSKEVRVVLIDNSPWFVAKDVCDILEHSDSRKAVSRLDEDEKLIGTIFLSGQNRETWLINEAGLYSLILTSRKPEAKAFKRWITHEVLPSIRQTGSYSLENSHFKLPTTFKEALIELVAKITENEQLQTLNTEQQLQLTEQQPKVEIYETLMDAEGYQNMNQVAKSIGWGRNRLYEFLREFNILIDSKCPFSRNAPYQQYIDKGYFKVIDVPVRSSEGFGISQQTLVSPKGVEYIIKLINSNKFDYEYIQGVKAMQKVGCELEI